MIQRHGHADGLLLLSELFPPAIGGSAVLFGEIYSRLDGTPVTVMSAGVGTPRWGISDARALWHYLRLGARLRAVAHRVRMVHCGRALPEGVAAFLSRRMGGSPYACWAHGEDIVSALTSRELTLLMRRVYRGAAFVFANSESTRRMVLDLGVAPSRTEVVYPGVDVDRFRPDIDGGELRPHLASPDEILLLSVGRLQSRKGHDLVIRALPQLTSAVPRVRYAIVGDGPERTRLEALARACGVRDRVTFVGEVTAEALPQYYAACDVFVLPNRIEPADVEGFGIVFLEAAAAGKPAVGGRSGGVPEAVLDGVTGLLVEGTDVNELALALSRLAAAGWLRRDLGASGRSRVCREFQWDRAARQVAAAHTRMLAGTAAC